MASSYFNASECFLFPSPSFRGSLHQLLRGPRIHAAPAVLGVYEGVEPHTAQAARTLSRDVSEHLGDHTSYALRLAFQFVSFSEDFYNKQIVDLFNGTSWQIRVKTWRLIHVNTMKIHEKKM